MRRSCLIILVAILFAACGAPSVKRGIAELKELGNTDPQLALERFDSIEHLDVWMSNHERKLLALLRVRLNDKADNIPTSDRPIKLLVQYFDKYGSKREQQEAHYYAGSVYRDLHDTPRALKHFLTARTIAEEYPQCDSVMLRNTYSNLCHLFYYVQDYKNAVAMARSEQRIAEELGILDIATLMYVEVSLQHTDSLGTATQVLKQIFQMIEEEGKGRGKMRAVPVTGRFSCTSPRS